MTYYELLEVREDASPEVIKMAYKGLIRKSHPDVYNGEKEGSNNKTKSLNEAYAVLSDSMAREQYDMYLKELREDIKYTKDREKVSKEERKNKRTLREESKTSPLDTSWIKVTLIIILPLIIIWGTYSIVSTLLSFSDYLKNYLIETHFIIIYGTDLTIITICVILAIISIFGLWYLKKWCLKTFYGVLIILPVLIGSSMANFDNYIGYDISFGMILVKISVSAIWVGIFSWGNFVYFERRKYLFNLNVSPPVIVTQNDGSKEYNTYVDKKKLIIFMGLILVLILLVSSSTYNFIAKDHRINYTVDIEQTIYTEYELKAKADNIAVYLEWDSFEELIQNIDNIEGTNYSASSFENQIKFLGEYLELTLYDNTQFYNPYSMKTINNLGDYLDYIYDALIEYYEGDY